jgi:hypothetical protein
MVLNTLCLDVAPANGSLRVGVAVAACCALAQLCFGGCRGCFHHDQDAADCLHASPVNGCMYKLQLVVLAMVHHVVPIHCNDCMNLQNSSGAPELTHRGFEDPTSGHTHFMRTCIAGR